MGAGFLTQYKTGSDLNAHGTQGHGRKHLPPGANAPGGNHRNFYGSGDSRNQYHRGGFFPSVMASRFKSFRYDGITSGVFGLPGKSAAAENMYHFDSLFF